MPYFRRLDGAVFTPTEHVSGAWETREQHIAPALGLMVHLVETDRDRRRHDGLAVSRLSYDILGTIPMEAVDIAVEVRRPGRTIELVEAVLTHAGRPAVLLRAWLMQQAETAELAGTELPSLPPPADLPRWDPTVVWAGGFIASAEVRRVEERPGRAAYWVRTEVALLDEPVSSTARCAGLFDIANGMTVRVSPSRVAFPNVDLTAHLFRQPVGDWLGFDTTVSFGPTGRGLTSSVLHDVEGPFGTLAQSLTVRPALPTGQYQL